MHFSLGVIVPKDGGFDRDYIQEEVNTKLWQYSERRRVPEYPKECDCVNWEAHCAGQEYAKKHAPINHRIITEMIKNAPDGKKPNRAELIKPYTAMVEEQEKLHPRYQMPVADCEECDGTGTYMTQYNPDSKWDWVVFGGRWSGYFTEEGENGSNQYQDDIEGNTTTTDKVVELLDNNKVPYALLTPSGKWSERGNKNDNWELEVEETLLKYPDHWFVTIDCHI